MKQFMGTVFCSWKKMNDWNGGIHHLACHVILLQSTQNIDSNLDLMDVMKTQKRRTRISRFHNSPSLNLLHFVHTVMLLNWHDNASVFPPFLFSYYFRNHFKFNNDGLQDKNKQKNSRKFVLTKEKNRCKTSSSTMIF